MRTSRFTLLFATLLVVVPAGHGTAADPASDLMRVSIKVLVNPLEGSPRTGCEASATSAQAGKMEWRVTFGEARPNSQKGWESAGNSVVCAEGSLDKTFSAAEVVPVAPYLAATVSATAALLPATLIPERIILLDLSLSLQKLSGFDKEGTPEYQPSEIKRRFYLYERRDVLVPVLVANNTEMAAFGIREVFLDVEPWRASDDSASQYGAVSVTSEIEGAEILLDGGVIGKTAGGKETLIRNVRPGLREIRVRDSAGREVWKAVRVRPNRTVLAELSLAGAPTVPRTYHLFALAQNEQGFEEFRREVDGAVVVKIPPGEFLMGNKNTERTPLEHRVYVSDFLMDKTGVTWRQFKIFLRATGTPLPPHEPYWGIHDDQPAVFVTWEEAKGYCEWVGGRLPTEAEREKAARGTDDRKYPWGNDEPDPQRGVFRHNWGSEATEAVGTHPAGASPYGLLDMGGNVWEYCSDWYEDGYYSVSPPKNPKGPATGTSRVVRGGSWDSRPAVLSASCRNWAYRGYREGDFGFRCAMNAPK